MHFFCDPSKLVNQPTVDAYGPIVTNIGSLPPETHKQYRVGSYFALTSTTDVKAFACQDSMMIVQPSTDPGLVNLILRPIQGVNINFPSVQYYVYRGIDINSFFNSGATAILPSTTSGLSDFLTRFWDNWATYQTVTGAVTTPTPSALGYPTAANPIVGTDLVDTVYNNSNTDIKAVKVSAGEWIGNFTTTATTTKIGFEIIIEAEHLTLDFDYFRQTEHIVDVTTLIDAVVTATSTSTPSILQAEFDLKTARETILSYVDPAAFFGMHFKTGVYVYDISTTSMQRKRKQQLYTGILTPFASKHHVYLDIRSERGYSYNFYDNYTDQATPIAHNLQIKDGSDPTPDLELHEISGWPILIMDDLNSSSGRKIEIQLHTRDNPAPALFVHDPKLLRNTIRNRHFINKDKLLVTGSDWTAPIKFKLFTENTNSHFIAYVIRLQYFRETNPTLTSHVIPKINNPLDMVFGSIQMPSIDGLTTVFKHSKSGRLQFIKGNDFSFAAYPESYQDAGNILFITELQYANKRSRFKRPKKFIATNTITDSPVFPEEIAFQKTKIWETAIDDIYVLGIRNYKNKRKKTTNLEDYYALGLSVAEHTSLITLANTGIGSTPALSNKHGQYLVLEPVVVSGSPILKSISVSGSPVLDYKKYELKLQGLDAAGTVQTLPSSIFVYSFDGRILASEAFAAAASVGERFPDPSQIKQWDHVGTWNYRVASTPIEINDYGFNPAAVADGGVAAPFFIELNANVFFPADYEGVTTPANISTIKSEYPLVVMVHGNGQFYESYDRLLMHLAQNGFIAASIDCTFSRASAPLVASGDPTYPFYILGYKPIGYNPVNGDLCLYDNATNSFPAANIMTWLSAGTDFTVATSGGTPTSITFRQALKALGGSHGMGGIGRASTLLHHLERIKTNFANHVENNIGLIGHSRGGEAIVIAKRLIDGALDIANIELTSTTTNITSIKLTSAPNTTNTSVNLTGINNINAIFSLAPTDQFQIERLQNTPYFLLYGSHDADVAIANNASRPDPNNNNISTSLVSYTGFTLWERSSGEEKFMAFVHGATHNGFVTFNRDDYNSRGEGGTVPGTVVNGFDFVATEGIQQTMLNAFANSFFRSYLKQEIFWKSLLKGEWLPDSITDPQAIINFQYQNKDSERLSIDNYNTSSVDNNLFDATGDATNVPLTTLNTGYVPNAVAFAAITFTDPVTAQTLWDIDSRLDFFSPYGTNIRLYDLSRSSTATIYSGTAINASSFSYLSFRIGIVFNFSVTLTADPPVPNPLVLANLSAMQVFLNGNPAVVPNLNDPIIRYDATQHHPLPFAKTKSAMATVRIPLQDFTGLTPAQYSTITEVRIDFGTAAGIVALDDFEFTN